MKVKMFHYSIKLYFCYKCIGNKVINMVENVKSSFFNVQSFASK